MATEQDQMLLARDVYRSWKRRIQGATESARVFTPYFDRMLDRLLDNAVLDVGAISVVTDLSPESGALDYRGQLIGVRAILRRGIEVQSLPRLHAKVLVCDGELVTVGSQNFTSYGRGSKETTAVLPDDVSTSDFASTLEEWYLAATPVSLELIEVLLAELEEAMRVARQAREQLTNAFDEQWDSYLEMREEERKRGKKRRSFVNRSHCSLRAPCDGVPNARRDRWSGQSSAWLVSGMCTRHSSPTRTQRSPIGGLALVTVPSHSHR